MELTSCEYSFAFGALTVAFTVFLSGFWDIIRYLLDWYREYKKSK